MDPHGDLREHVLDLLASRNAHLGFDRAIEAFTPEARRVRPEGFPHTAWELLEHLRICQWDILEFSKSAAHVSPQFPAGYWPPEGAPPDPGPWEASVEAFRRDLEEMRSLVADPAADLFSPFPWGQGQTLLREALLVADHNAYHVGQLVVLARCLGVWPVP